jgi:hypothetical protein
MPCRPKKRAKKIDVILWSYPRILTAMYRQIIALLVMTVLATSPSIAFASGSGTTSARSFGDLDRFNSRHPVLSTAPAPQIKIAQVPYNLGKALFSGKYKFGKPNLTAVNIAEKMQRLVILQKALPAREREKVNPPALAGQLTDREMNALEYYLAVRFGKFVGKPPSWAEQEPPPKLASTQ